MQRVAIGCLASIALLSTVSNALIVNTTQTSRSDALSDRPRAAFYPAFLRSLTLTESANGEERATRSTSVAATLASKIKHFMKRVWQVLFHTRDDHSVASPTELKQDPRLARAEAFAEIERLAQVKASRRTFWFRNNKKLSQIKSLIKQYGDDVMAQALFTAWKADSDRTQQTALQLLVQLQDYWRRQGKSETDVFELLKLNGVEKHRAISDGRITILHQYIKTISGTESSDAILIQTLLHGYGGDDKFALVLGPALKESDDFTQEVALQLEDHYFISMKNKNPSFDDLFQRLKLNDKPNDYQAISDGRLTLLERFIQSKRREDSSDAVLIQTLLHGYGGDEKFVLVLDPALKHSDDSTWEAAFELEKKYLSILWNENLSFDDLFHRLKMNDGPKAYVAISDGRLALLELFIKMHGHGEASDSFLIQTLVKGYGGDDKFAQVLHAAKMDGDQFLQTAAHQLKIKNFITLLDHEVSYDDLFSKLKLNDGLIKYEAVYDGRIKLLNEYIQFKSGDSSSDSALIQTLVKGYGGDEKFALVLFAAQKDEKTIEEAAHALEIKYFETLSREVSLQDLFKRLKARREDASLFGSWKLKMLERYAAYVSNSEPQKDVSMISVLKDGFGGTDKLATLLMKAKRKSRYMAVVAKRYEQELFSTLVTQGTTSDTFMMKVFPNGFRNENMARAFHADFKTYLTQRDVDVGERTT
ncbi:hypothetical protein PsorP6_002776 [Peronosclerospora sorghi]|uniref:Uncharacterized protein n=1 Tax=Peronosclerospora sorghi TaxID=230839 RepID=A0ACC0VP22_9STRA|nr:hypothetical protein PsorP6_002776 [Peronosclerospora sorghi]